MYRTAGRRDKGDGTEERVTIGALRARRYAYVCTYMHARREGVAFPQIKRRLILRRGYGERDLAEDKVRRRAPPQSPGSRYG